MGKRDANGIKMFKSSKEKHFSRHTFLSTVAAILNRLLLRTLALAIGHFFYQVIMRIYNYVQKIIADIFAQLMKHLEEASLAGFHLINHLYVLLSLRHS